MFPGSIDLYLPEYCHFGLEIVSRPDVTDPVQHLQIRCSRFLLLFNYIHVDYLLFRVFQVFTCPNWLQGKARMAKSSANSACSAFNSWYWKVEPQKVATFTTSTT